MPKLPRVSGAEALKALQKLGFEKVRQSGSHVIARRVAKGCVTPMLPEVLDNLAAGATSEEILEQYPGLRQDHVLAALAYAADLARSRKLARAWSVP